MHFNINGELFNDAIASLKVFQTSEMDLFIQYDGDEHHIAQDRVSFISEDHCSINHIIHKMIPRPLETNQGLPGTPSRNTIVWLVPE